VKINATTMSNQASSCKWLRISFWCAAIALGFADAWATRFTMNPDGISYLDMGDAYLRGNWHMAINAYWSPLYSWFLGFFLKVLRPSAYWEFPVAHLVSFLFYVAALASFEFLISTFVAYEGQRDKEAPDASNLTFPSWAWRVLGYGIFIWSSLVLIGMRFVTPDMCLAALVYLAAGLILKVQHGAASRRVFVLLGIVLGFAYLAKAVMFPLAFVFLAVALFSQRKVRKVAPRVLLSALVFLAIASPLLTVLSKAKGRFTFGDSGRWNYVVFVDGADYWFPSGTTLKNPKTKIFDSPATYDCSAPVAGTYPYWYDPTYWYEGLEPHFDRGGEIRAVRYALAVYCWLLFNPSLQLMLTTGLCVLYLLAPNPSRCFVRAFRNWPLIAIGSSALVLYALVYVEFRHIAPFVTLLWLAAFSGTELPVSLTSRRLLERGALAIVILIGASLIWSPAHRVLVYRKPPVYAEAARAMLEKGIKAGDKLAVIADEPNGEGGAFVARLARVRIVVLVAQPEQFWAAPVTTRSQVIQAAAKAGAKVLLTRSQVPVSEVGWERLGSTDYYISVLSEQ
jgi:hypothetical protein